MSVPRYPDLGAAPRGWTRGQVGATLRLVPPGADLDRSRAAMIVSALVPCDPLAASPAALVERALAREVHGAGAEILYQSDPSPYQTTSGLQGVRVEATIQRTSDQQIERSALVLLQDRAWVYCFTYIADEDVYEHFRDTFNQVAASILPHPAG